MNPHLAASPLVAILRSLDLPPADYVVAGSGPMLPAGLRQPADLDLVARGGAWDAARSLGQPSRPKSGEGDAVTLAGNAVEVFTRWPGHPADDLIGAADVIDGIRWVRLVTVLEWKRKGRRGKDRADAALIAAHLATLAGAR
jgi:hypothetical protein